jgi:hypothetical protein
MIRVVAKINIYLMTWLSINMVNIYIRDMIADYTTFLHKIFSEGVK